MTQDPAALANLRDVALPPPIAWWPPTLGWWILAAGFLVCLVLLAIRWLRHIHANAYRRAAVRELKGLMSDTPAPTSAPAIALVLKRTALAAYPRSAVAALTGEAWADFLQRSGGFATKTAALMNRATFDPAHPLSHSEAGEVLSASLRWVRRHRHGPL